MATWGIPLSTRFQTWSSSTPAALLLPQGQAALKTSAHLVPASAQSIPPPTLLPPGSSPKITSSHQVPLKEERCSHLYSQWLTPAMLTECCPRPLENDHWDHTVGLSLVGEGRTYPMGSHGVSQ